MGRPVGGLRGAVALAAFKRDSSRSSEAGMKYFVLGALSSGMLLYGASLIYGFTGHVGFPEIAEALSAGDRSLGVVFGTPFRAADFYPLYLTSVRPARLHRVHQQLGQRPVYRVVFNEITKKAVNDAVANPRDLSMDLVNAQQARRALDYLVGFNLSPVNLLLNYLLIPRMGITGAASATARATPSPRTSPRIRISSPHAPSSIRRARPPKARTTITPSSGS